MVKVSGYKAMPYASTSNCGMLILAGGESRRMGQDKASLRLPSGISLLEYQLHRFKLNFAPVMVSVHQPGLAKDIIALADKFKHYLGPVAGICSSILAIRDNYPWLRYLLIIPVDMPYLTDKLLLDLINADTIAGYYRGHPLPLMLQLTENCYQYVASVAAALAAGNSCSVREFIHNLGGSPQQLPCATPKLLNNLNYPWQWEQFYNEATM